MSGTENTEAGANEPERTSGPPRFMVGTKFLIGGVWFVVRKVTRKDLIIRPIGVER